MSIYLKEKTQIFTQNKMFFDNIIKCHKYSLHTFIKHSIIVVLKIM